MAQTIQLKRGLKANIPASASAAEPLVTTDTHEMYLGTGGGLSPLKVDYANVLNAPASAAVSSVNTKTGDVVLSTSDIAEGSRLYYTDVRADARVAAGIAAAIIDGGTF
jgi:hypothetical protein